MFICFFSSLACYRCRVASLEQPLSPPRCKNSATAFACFSFFFRKWAVSSSKPHCPMRYLFLFGSGSPPAELRFDLRLRLHQRALAPNRERTQEPWLHANPPAKFGDDAWARPQLGFFLCLFLCRLTRAVGVFVGCRRRIIRPPLMKVA